MGDVDEIRNGLVDYFITYFTKDQYINNFLRVEAIVPPIVTSENLVLTVRLLDEEVLDNFFILILQRTRTRWICTSFSSKVL